MELYILLWVYFDLSALESLPVIGGLYFSCIHDSIPSLFFCSTYNRFQWCASPVYCVLHIMVGARFPVCVVIMSLDIYVVSRFVLSCLPNWCFQPGINSILLCSY